MGPKIEYIKICPRCGSIDFQLKSFVQLLMPVPEKCKKCSYRGLFPEIDINEIENFRKKIKKKN